MLRDADLVDRSRVVMEKPFGTDLESAIVAQRPGARDVRREPDLPDRPLPGQGGGAEHPGLPVRQRAVRADLEPQLHRPHPDRHPRDARAGPAGQLLRGRPAPTRTWSSPTCCRCWRSSRWSRRRRWSRARSARRRTRSSARCCRSTRTTWSAASTAATAARRASRRDSDTETFIALKCGIDNWRWAGVPFYLRTGKKMAEGMRIISIAFKEAPRTMFPSGLRRRRRRARTT